MSRRLWRTTVTSMVVVLVTAACQQQPDVSRIPSTRPTPARYVSSIHIDGPDTLSPGSSAQLHLVKQWSDGVQEDATTNAVWSSSDPKVMTVTAGGLAAAVSVGAVKISAASGLNASKPMLAVPDGTYDLSGRVLENGVGIGRMTVTVAIGIGQGTTAVTDATGAYTLYGVAGTIELHVSRDGYFTASQTMTVTGLNARAPDVTVTPIIAPANLSGAWQLTIVPATTCTAPVAAVGPRTFNITITQTGADAVMAFAAADMFKRSPRRTSSAHITGNVLEFTLSAAVDGYYKFYSPNLLYDVMEVLDGNRFLGFSGDAHLDGSMTSVAGAFNGNLDVFAGNGDYWGSSLAARCTSTTHAVVMTK